MHLATLTPYLSRSAGGLFPLIQGLNQALLTEGLEIDVLAFDDPCTEHDRASWQPLRTQTFALRGLGGFAYAPGMANVLERLDPDLVHSHGLWLYHSWLAERWARRRQRPSLISPQGMLDPWALRHLSWKKHLAALAFERRHLRSADCLHAVSVAEVEAIRAYGLRNPIALIPNAVDLPDTELTGALPPWPESFQEGGSVILFLGRLHPKKGLVPLLEGWAQLRQRDPKSLERWRLAIAGWDQLNHRSQLEELAARLQISSTIHFCGPLHGAGKDAAFRHADAFVLSSFSEGMPTAVLEAMAYGLPVLMSQACNFPEGFDARAALEVEPSVGSVAAGLARFVALSVDERSAMGARGRELVAERYTWATLAPRMRAVYAWLLGGGAPPPDVILA